MSGRDLGRISQVAVQAGQSSHLELLRVWVRVYMDVNTCACVCQSRGRPGAAGGDAGKGEAPGLGRAGTAAQGHACPVLRCVPCAQHAPRCLSGEWVGVWVFPRPGAATEDPHWLPEGAWRQPTPSLSPRHHSSRSPPRCWGEEPGLSSKAHLPARLGSYLGRRGQREARSTERR